MNIDFDQLKATLLSNGRLRAAINYGNPVLAQRGPEGQPQGVSVALATELARRLGVTLDIVPFEAAGKVVDYAAQDVWDIGFLAIDPKRAEEVCFTAPYVLIEGTYLVRESGPYSEIDQLDAGGVRIAVGKGAAYDLYLSRALQHAELVRGPTSASAIELFLEQGLDAAAGVRQPLEAAAREHAGLKVLPGHFTAIRQAMIVPASKAAALPQLRAYVEAMKASGFIAQALVESGQGADLVAPAESHD